MIDVAEHGDGKCVSIKESARRLDCSQKYLEQVASQLAKGGLLRSLRGSSGGYILTRLPKDYTAGDILRVTEGSLSPISCVETISTDCPRLCECATIDFWYDFNRVIQNFVDSVTLEDLVRNKDEKAGNNYCI
jgi:Rrf2 family protein